MRNAFKSFRVNIAPEHEDAPMWAWRRYANKQMRNKAKEYRRKRKVAGTATEPAPRRMRYYRPIGRNGKVTRLERLQDELARDQNHVHDEHCDHNHKI